MTELAPTTPTIRHDGWTPHRRERSLTMLAAGLDVGSACRGVGLSREAAYRLRRRDAGFAHRWSEAQRAARAAAEQAFLAMLPEKLRRTLWELSGACDLGAAEPAAQDPVRVVQPASTSGPAPGATIA